MSELRAHILKIIESVKNKKCIWDATSENFGKRNKVDIAWREIAEEVGNSENFCKEKWRNVRTGFLRSINEYASSCPSVKKKPFYLHDEMQFIVPYLKRSGTNDFHTEFVDKYNGSEEMLSEDEQETLISYEESLPPDDYKANIESTSVFFKEHTNDRLTSTGSLEISRCPKRRKLEPDMILLKHLTDKAKRPTEESTWLSFVKGLMPDILSLPSHKQRLLKKQFVDCINELHMSEI